MTAVVGSAAEDTTPSEREAPQRFAWWHPRSVDLGRHKARREPPARPSTVPDDAAPSEDGLAVGDRITMGGAPGTVVALPERGWWKLRLDGEETVRSARRTKFDPASGPPAKAPRRAAGAAAARVATTEEAAPSPAAEDAAPAPRTRTRRPRPRRAGYAVGLRAVAVRVQETNGRWDFDLALGHGLSRDRLTSLSLASHFYGQWPPQAPQLGLKIVLGYRSVRGKRTQDRDWTVAPAYSNAVSTKLVLSVW